jgi:dTDP-4-dehydrorhamnose reductase
MEQTILITGSNGLLGQKLVHLLSQFPEIKLIATAKGPNRLTGDLNYTYVSLDITNELEVLEVFKTYKPDALIHTAAMTNVDTCEADPEGCELLNVTAVFGTAIEYTKIIGITIVHPAFVKY